MVFWPSNTPGIFNARIICKYCLLLPKSYDIIKEKKITRCANTGKKEDDDVPATIRNNIIANNVFFVNLEVKGKKDTKRQIKVKAKEEKAKRPPEKKARDRKKLSVRIANKLYQIGEERRALHMKACNTVITLYKCGHCGKTKVANAHLCRDRLCPTCQYLLSVRRYNEMTQCIEHLGEQVNTMQWRFITLTIKNCDPDKLSYTIDKMFDAWNKICMRRTIKAALAGWARKLEITYNQEARQFHPHIHILAAFYKGKTPDMYDIRKWWKEALDIDYEPICDIIEPYKKDDREAIQAAIIEAFKYTCKSNQVAEMPLQDFAELVRAIKGRRIVAFGGIIRKARKELGLKDTDEPDQEVKGPLSCCNDTMEELILEWSFGESEYKIIQATKETENMNINKIGEKAIPERAYI